jgi:hypothetical protein
VGEPAGSHPPTSRGFLEGVARGDWAGRALRIVLVLAISSGAGWLLAPAGAHRLPGPESLGMPAPATVKADRDYGIVDGEATARRRAEAAQAERAVYLHDEGAAEEASARVHAAFALMREEEAALPARPGRDPGDLQRLYQAQRDAFVSRLQVLVRTEDLSALADARFSEGVEHEIAALARRGCGTSPPPPRRWRARPRRGSSGTRPRCAGRCSGSPPRWRAPRSSTIRSRPRGGGRRRRRG